MQADMAYLNGTAKVGNTNYYHSSSYGPDNSSLALQGGDADLSDSNLDGRARNALLEKLKDQKANLAELGAETVRTAKLMENTAWNFINCFIHLKHGRYGAAARALGVPPKLRRQSRFSKEFAKRGSLAAANGWLSLRYGWEPLLQDIYGSCEVIAAKHESIGFVTCRKRVKRITNLDKKISTVLSGKQVETQVLTGTKSTYIQYSVTYYKSKALVTSLAQLGCTNPALLAWELVPYSFVVDWMLPIGSWLSNQDATLGLEFYSGYSTIFSKTHWNSELTRVGVNASNIFRNQKMNEAKMDVFCKRTVLTSFPSSAPPSFKNPLSIRHMENALALLTNLFRK